MAYFSIKLQGSPNLIVMVKTLDLKQYQTQLNYNFDYIAPHNWNSLPDIVRLAPSVPTFRKRLKTYLFWQAFSPP